MGIKKIVTSWDFVGALIATFFIGGVWIYFDLALRGEYALGFLCVSSIVGGLFLAYFLESITLMASMQDQEFGQWIEEKRGALTITLRTFTYTLALTAITMMFSIGSLVAVAFHQTTIIPPWVGIPSFFLFSYSVLAAVAQASNTYDYVRTRIMYLHRKSQGES